MELLIMAGMDPTSTQDEQPPDDEQILAAVARRELLDSVRDAGIQEQRERQQAKARSLQDVQLGLIPEDAEMIDVDVSGYYPTTIYLLTFPRCEAAALQAALLGGEELEDVRSEAQARGQQVKLPHTNTMLFVDPDCYEAVAHFVTKLEEPLTARQVVVSDTFISLLDEAVSRDVSLQECIRESMGMASHGVAAQFLPHGFVFGPHGDGRHNQHRERYRSLPKGTRFDFLSEIWLVKFQRCGKLRKFLLEGKQLELARMAAESHSQQCSLPPSVTSALVFVEPDSYRATVAFVKQLPEPLKASHVIISNIYLQKLKDEVAGTPSAEGLRKYTMKKLVDHGQTQQRRSEMSSPRARRNTEIAL